MSNFLPSSDPGANVTVTKEEFNLFHNVDRQLFARLVLVMGRDTSQATHILAFLMWLEKVSKDFRMISNLNKWPDTLLNDLANEAVLALTCIESEQFPFSGDKEKCLPLIQNITRSSVSLQFFHDNRMGIIPAVTRILNDVCIRAFTDIVQQVHHQNTMKEHNLNSGKFYGTMSGPFVPQVVYVTPAPPPAGVTVVPQHMGMGVPTVAAPQSQWHEGSSSSSSWGGPAGFDPYDVSYQKDFNAEFTEILAKLQLGGGGGGGSAGSGSGSGSTTSEKKELSADDRTIFMTFSKGYPISETEVREFFSRKYGDIIEAVYMQDVLPMEQPLYARLVVRPAATNKIDTFLEGTGKVKFSFNGKHVWARRYVRKNKSPQTSPVSSRPDSPHAAGTSH